MPVKIGRTEIFGIKNHLILGPINIYGCVPQLSQKKISVRGGGRRAGWGSPRFPTDAFSRDLDRLHIPETQNRMRVMIENNCLHKPERQRETLQHDHDISYRMKVMIENKERVELKGVLLKSGKAQNNTDCWDHWGLHKKRPTKNRPSWHTQSRTHTHWGGVCHNIKFHMKHTVDKSTTQLTHRVNHTHTGNTQ